MLDTLNFNICMLPEVPYQDDVLPRAANHTVVPIYENGVYSPRGNNLARPIKIV